LDVIANTLDIVGCSAPRTESARSARVPPVTLRYRAGGALKA
jgi:hypothetical protein